MGDAAMNEERPLPQIAQVAAQQAQYLSKVIKGEKKQDEEPFEFFGLGSMASLGGMKGIYDGSQVGKTGEEVSVARISGFFAFVSSFSFCSNTYRVQESNILMIIAFIILC